MQTSATKTAGGETVLAVRAPFHLEATVRVLQRRPTNRVDLWEDGRYRRVFRTPDGLVLAEVENRGTVDRPDVRLAVRSGTVSPAALSHLVRTVRQVLGLDVDPTPFERRATDPALRPAVVALRGMRPPRFAGLFEAFANVVPFQQLSLEAGAAIVARLVERFGEALELGGRRFYAFPRAHAIADARPKALLACGLSVRKAETLRYIGRLIVSGELDEAELARLPTNRALEALRAVPGIGPWSAGLVLLRGFGRLDVFPPGDVGATRGLGVLLQVPPGPPLQHAVERFGDLRGYLYFYALGASLLGKGLIHAAPSVRHRRRGAR